MKDVAELAGVSTQTVSFVINDIPVVADETRGRVLEAINQLNYTPHAAARSLRSGRSRIIGLMIPDAQNPHFWDTVTGAEQEAQANGYSLLLATTSMDRQQEKLAFSALAQQRLDGLIPLFTYPEDFRQELETLLRDGVAIATSASGVPLPDIGVDIVQNKYETAAQELMQHLLELGHRRIAMIWGVARNELANQRVVAYRESLQAAGIPLHPEYLIRSGHTLEDGFLAAKKLLDLDPQPTAIIGINDLMAFGAVQASLRRGLRVPQDISVAGFDDLPMSKLLSPPLTTGAADGAEVGRQCVRLVLQRLKDPDLPPQRVDLPTHLVIRESTGPCPQEDSQEPLPMF